MSTAKVEGSESSRFISVVLGGNSGAIRFNDSKKIIEYGINNFEERVIVEKGEVLGYSEILSDEYIPIEFVAKDSVSVVTEKHANISIDKVDLLGERDYDMDILNGEEIKSVLKLEDGTEKEVILIANRGISIFVNDDPIIFQENNPFIKDETTYVPLRQIFESIGLDVDWDQVTRTITGKNDNITFTVDIDSELASLNGKQIESNVPIMIVEGIAMAPIRFIAETLGAKVQWQNDIRVVKISQ